MDSLRRTRNPYRAALAVSAIMLLALTIVGCSDSAAAETPEGTIATSTPTVAPTATPDEPAIYIVRSGDTGWDIAQRFGITLSELATANGKSVPEMATIFPGDRLVISR